MQFSDILLLRVEIFSLWNVFIHKFSSNEGKYSAYGKSTLKITDTGTGTVFCCNEWKYSSYGVYSKIFRNLRSSEGKYSAYGMSIHS